MALLGISVALCGSLAAVGGESRTCLVERPCFGAGRVVRSGVNSVAMRLLPVALAGHILVLPPSSTAELTTHLLRSFACPRVLAPQ